VSVVVLTDDFTGLYLHCWLYVWEISTAKSSHKVAYCQRLAMMLGFSSLLLLIGMVAIAMANPLSRTIEVINESGKKLVVERVHPQTGEVITLSQGLENGAKTTLNSYVKNHELSDETCAAKIDGRGCQVRSIKVDDSTEQGTTSSSSF
jgi:hypothetical protein